MSVFSLNSRNGLTSSWKSEANSKKSFKRKGTLFFKDGSVKRLKRKASNFVNITTIQRLNKIEEKRKKEQLEKKLALSNQQRKYLRKYLVCLHILKTGLMKCAYYFYTEKQKKNKSKKKKKKNKEKTYRILLSTNFIRNLNDEFKEEDINSPRFMAFQSEYNMVKLKHPKFNSENDSKSRVMSSAQNIDHIDERLTDEDNSLNTSQSLPQVQKRLSESKNLLSIQKTDKYKFPLTNYKRSISKNSKGSTKPPLYQSGSSHRFPPIKTPKRGKDISNKGKNNPRNVKGASSTLKKGFHEFSVIKASLERMKKIK
ncbi:unnamed protein product [Moneuplotes crassus]|uniref:Uncharacterized protein n=1 Tax=Euplotes crassus TaxID=5936 RepID=A0AAD1YAJ1_EUPCR|nr:unnamed protein product [Moneuplotes crassus]